MRLISIDNVNLIFYVIELSTATMFDQRPKNDVGDISDKEKV